MTTATFRLQVQEVIVYGDREDDAGGCAASCFVLLCFSKRGLLPISKGKLTAYAPHQRRLLCRLTVRSKELQHENSAGTNSVGNVILQPHHWCLEILSLRSSRGTESAPLISRESKLDLAGPVPLQLQPAKPVATS